MVCEFIIEFMKFVFFLLQGIAMVFSASKNSRLDSINLL
jgi:hypothetical protein